MLQNSEKNNPSDFDIRDYRHLLGDRTKEGKYTCPNCGGHNLSVNKNNGKYDCYNCGDTKAIFKAIKQKAGEWEGKWEKPVRTKQIRYYNYPTRSDKPFVRVQREDLGDGKKKKFYQQQWVANRNQYINGLGKNEKKPGTIDISRADIPAYRYKEVQQAIAGSKKIFIVEGEATADVLWQLGIPATCNIGGSQQSKESDSQDLKGAKVVICPDRDIKGIKHAELIAKDFPDPVKFDNAQILQGVQGIGKSTFFEALAGADFFTDDMGNISDKDEKIKPHYSWMVEWSELENIFDKAKESSIKAYLTCKTDNIRPPYARSSKKMNRGFSICGTTNKSEFLTDQIGNRRFWVIQLLLRKGEQIDIYYVKQHRDKLWGAVMAAIADNEHHWLNQENAALAELEANKSVWRNPDVQDILIPVFHKKLAEGTNKISRQEINDILDKDNKTQTAAQLDKFMSTYELAKGARNISYCKRAETFPKKDYRGFCLTDDEGQIPPKLLQAFEDFGLEHPVISSLIN